MKDKPAVLFFPLQISQKPALCRPEISTAGYKSRFNLRCHLTRANRPRCTLTLTEMHAQHLPYLMLKTVSSIVGFQIPTSLETTRLLAGIAAVRSLKDYLISQREAAEELQHLKRQQTIPYWILVTLAQERWRLSNSTWKGHSSIWHPLPGKQFSIWLLESSSDYNVPSSASQITRSIPKPLGIWCYLHDN